MCSRGLSSWAKIEADTARFGQRAFEVAACESSQGGEAGPQRVSRFVFSCLTVLGVAGHQLLVTQIQRTPLHVTRPQDGLAKKRKKPDASTEIHPSAAETVPVAPEPRDSQTNGTILSFRTADMGISEQPRKRGQDRNCDCVLVTGGSVTGIISAWSTWRESARAAAVLSS